MTAEIAIMNQSAVALAADSAVIAETSGGVKIYNTVNKLFALSRLQPVGIIIFGNSQFIGVPWETVIKMFRFRLDKITFFSFK